MSDAETSMPAAAAPVAAQASPQPAPLIDMRQIWGMVAVLGILQGVGPYAASKVSMGDVQPSQVYARVGDLEARVIKLEVHLETNKKLLDKIEGKLDKVLNSDD